MPHIWTMRALILLPALLITAILGGFFAQWLSVDGLGVGEVIWLALICTTFFWVSFVFCMSLSGAVLMMRAGRTNAAATLTPSMKVAILMPVYNEDVAAVFANLLAMQDDLVSRPHHHSFSAFILSDSQTPQIIEQEMRAYEHARITRGSSRPLYYRRRDDNRGYKAGNLHQWVREWGADYDAMLVLDADSLMTADAILRLTNTLGGNPGIGLVQGALQVFRGRRLFARLQQFSNTAYGGLFANGLNLWSGYEGNYFGHNAIVRTRAFATCAGLPDLPTRDGRLTPILSHDFVEAALLRRAGWGVKILPDLEGSWEGVPETLVDYIRRDRRWCQGNMQHLRIMWAAGLHPISRFHMFFNALGYLMSPIWLALILIWIGHGFIHQPGTGAALSTYGLAVFLVIIILMLAPKLVGQCMILASASKRQAFGGGVNSTISFFLEIIMSVLNAPILMVHQTISIYRSFVGYPVQWGASARSGIRYPLKVLLKFHAVETAFGLVLTVGVMSGFLSTLLLPNSLSLMFAAILSYFSTIDLSRFSNVANPGMTDANRPAAAVLSKADQHRKAMEKIVTSTVDYKRCVGQFSPSYVKQYGSTK